MYNRSLPRRGKGYSGITRKECITIPFLRNERCSAAQGFNFELNVSFIMVYLVARGYMVILSTEKWTPVSIRKSVDFSFSFKVIMRLGRGVPKP